MKLKLNLFVKSNGSVRITKRDDGAYQDEIYLKLELLLPDALFKRPVINASVNLMAADIEQFILNPTIKTDLQNAIEGVVGADITLTITNPDSK